jgi:hypothetical protein
MHIVLHQQISDEVLLIEAVKASSSALALDHLNRKSTVLDWRVRTQNLHQAQFPTRTQCCNEWIEDGIFGKDQEVVDVSQQRPHNSASLIHHFPGIKVSTSSTKTILANLYLKTKI